MNRLLFRKPVRDSPETQYLNILRCGAIYLVILLHNFAPFFTKLYLFGTKTWWVMDILSGLTRMGVPLFFMISGYLALSDQRTEKIFPFYRRRIGKLLLPLLVWNGIYFLFNGLLYQQPMDGLAFLNQLLGKGSKYHLWFLYQIIGLYLLAPFLKRITDHVRKRELFVLFLVILLVPTLFHFINGVQAAVTVAPFGALVEGYAGFFLYGYLLGTVTFPPWAKRLIYVAGIGGLLLGVFGNFLQSSPQVLCFRWNEGYSITHYLTSGALFLLIKEMFAEAKGPLSAWKTWVLSIANPLSKRTFGIYLSHVLFIEIFTFIVSKNNISFHPATQIIVGFIFSAIGSTIFSFVCQRIPGLRRII
jgi:surface polysaccharide O-acyltransferase-like enzyme